MKKSHSSTVTERKRHAANGKSNGIKSVESGELNDHRIVCKSRMVHRSSNFYIDGKTRTI